MRCSHCGNDCAPDADFCPKCGKKNPTMFAGCAIALVIGVIILLAMAAAGDNKGKGTPSPPSQSGR